MKSSIKQSARKLKLHPFVWLTLLAATTTNAKHLGQVGPVFPIGEIDMLVWIDNRLKQFEANGKMADMQEEFTNRVRESIENPPPVDGLKTTTSPNTFYVDPSIVIPKDIIAPTTGAVIARAGTKINPFDSETWPKANGEKILPKFQLSKVLVFFDARDAKQRRFATQYSNKKPIKWILTGGSPNQMAELLDSRIYFAQNGSLTQELNITHVPSIAYQEGTKWRIDEIDVSNLPPLNINNK